MNERDKTIKKKLIEAEETRDTMIKRLAVIAEDIDMYKEILRLSGLEVEHEQNKN